jgi:uncharacterized protein (DUF1330 family)
VQQPTPRVSRLLSVKGERHSSFDLAHSNEAISMNGHASGTSVVVVSVTFTALAAAFVASRTYARLVVAKNPGLDDVAIVFAMVG